MMLFHEKNSAGHFTWKDMIRPQGLLLISFIFHVIAYIAGAYYPVATEIYVKNLVSGRLHGVETGTPVSFGFLTVISDIFAWLYRSVPSIEWFDVYLFLSSVVSLSVFLYLFTNVLMAKFRPGKQYGYWVLFSLLTALSIYYENTRLLEFTRVSLIHIISAMCILILSDNRISFRHFLLYILIPVLGAILVRVESIVYVVLLILPLLAIRNRSIIHFKYLLTVLLFSLPLLFFFFKGIDGEDERYMKFRPYQFALFDYSLAKDVQFDHVKDSLAISLAETAYMNDAVILDVLYSDKYLKKLDKNPLHIGNYIQSADKNFKMLKYKLKLGERYKWLLYSLIPLLIFLLGRLERKRIIFMSTLYTITVFCIITLFMKMEERILLPLYISFLISFLYLVSDSKFVYKYTLALVLFIFTVMNYKLASVVRLLDLKNQYFNCIQDELSGYI